MFNPIKYMLNIFKKKQEQISFPGRFAIVKYSKHAKEKGIFDDENKVVEIYSGGVLAEPVKPYSKELINALVEIEGIPVIDEIFKDEPFEFEEVADFGSAQYRL